MNTKIIATAVTAVALVGCQEQSAFDYESASAEERSIWLEKQASRMRDGLDDGLNNYGGTRGFEVQDPKIDRNRRLITFTARMMTPGNPSPMQREQRERLELSLCKDYLRTAFPANNVKTTIIMNSNSGRRVFGAKQSPSSCEKLATRSSQ